MSAILPTPRASVLKLRRRCLLAMGAARLAMPGIARGAPVRLLKIGYAFGLNSHLGLGARAFAEAVERGTDGRYLLEQRPDGVLGGELETIDGVIDGEIELGLITGAPLAQIIPEVGVLDIPFLFRDAPHAHAVLDGPIGQAYLGMFERKRLVALAWGENGLRHVTNALHPVHAAADLRGLRIRVPQSDVIMRGFQALGADPEQLPFSQLYGALEKGRFDAQENPIAVIEAAHFARVQKHLSLTRHVYNSAVFLLSQEVWQQLDSADRAVFKQAAIVGGAATRRAAGESESNGVRRLQQEGMAVVSDVDRASFEAALASIRPEFERMFGAEALARISAFPRS